ncbi:MAG: hypothetical protein ACR2RD_08425, partial [Woeseiaceae bacterium]
IIFSDYRVIFAIFSEQGPTFVRNQRPSREECRSFWVQVCALMVEIVTIAPISPVIQGGFSR